MYKLLSLPVLLVVTVGCGSNWRTIPTDPVCTPYPWFLDEDGDGWGDPGVPGVVQCYPDTDAKFTVKNNRDCDDGDPAITGRAGSLCPDDVLFPYGPDADTAVEEPESTGQVRQFSAGTVEYLMTGVSAAELTDGSSVVWPEFADDVCSPEGWGGTYVVETADGIQEEQIDTSIDPAGLLVISDATELGEIKAEVDALGHEYWAGWLRTRVNASNQWEWDVMDPSAPLAFGSIGFCDGVSTPPTDASLPRLALIKRKNAGTADQWCLGTPDQVWGRYFRDVVTAADSDGDGLPDSSDEEPNDFDADDDGVGDGQEVDVIDARPDLADAYPVLDPNQANPTVAFQTELAYYVCERNAPNPVRFEMHDLPGVEGP